MRSPSTMSRAIIRFICRLACTRAAIRTSVIDRIWKRGDRPERRRGVHAVPGFRFATRGRAWTMTYQRNTHAARPSTPASVRMCSGTLCACQPFIWKVPVRHRRRHLIRDLVERADADADDRMRLKHVPRFFPDAQPQVDSGIQRPVEERRRDKGCDPQVIADDDRRAGCRRSHQHDPSPPVCGVEQAHRERRKDKDEQTHSGQEQVVGQTDDGPHRAVEEANPPPLVADESGQEKRRQEVEDPGDLVLPSHVTERTSSGI